MPQAITFDTAPTPNTTSWGIGSMFRVLPTLVLLLAACGLVATTMLDGSTDVTVAPRLAAAPTALPPVAAVGSTTVPDASAVFGGREVKIEEPVPTF